MSTSASDAVTVEVRNCVIMTESQKFLVSEFQGQMEFAETCEVLHRPVQSSVVVWRPFLLGSALMIFEFMGAPTSMAMMPDLRNI